MRNGNRIFIKTAMVSSILMANAVMADNVLEEVIVTAEKREASIQDTPISMEAFTEAAIERRGVTDISSLLNAVPGMAGYEAPSARGNFSINLRGIGSGNPNSPSTDPANAIYVDGVYLGKGAGNGVDAMDLERIEVLRGPQGTLYGRNSTGGAVNFITKKPGEKAGYKVKVSKGNYGMSALSGRFDLPLSDSAGLAISGYKRERDHLYGNTNPDVPGFENINRDGYRIAFRFNPSDALSLDYAYSHDELDENAQMMDVVGLNPRDPGVAAAVAANPAYALNVPINSAERAQTVAALAGGVKQLQGAYQFDPTTYAAYAAFMMPQVSKFVGWADDYIAWSASELASRDSRPANGSSDSESRSMNKVDSHALTLTWDVDNVTFKSITGIRKVENLNQGDLDGIDNSQIVGDLPLLTIGGLLFNQVVPDNIPAGPVNYGIGAAEEFGLALNMINAIDARGAAPIYSNYAHIDHDQFSQEFQMVGTSDTLDYVLGLYFYEDDTEFRNHRVASFPLATSDTSSYDVNSEAFSVFGQATWRASESSPLSVTAGLRYTEETKGITYLWKGYNSNFINMYYGAKFTGNAASYSVGNNYVSNEGAENLPERAGIYGREFEEDFSNVSGKLTVQYEMSEDMNVYATYSTGYRSGGFNGDFFDTANDAADAFSEEEIENFEVGMKSTFWDGRAQFNAALFSYDYTNLQVSTVLAQGNTVTSAIGNAGSTSREGGELSLLVSPIDDMVVSLAYTFIDGTFDEYPDISANGNVLEMTELTKRGLTPDEQINLGVNWTLMRADKGQLDWSVDASYQGETYPLVASTGVYSVNNVASIPVSFEQLPNQERTLVNTRFSWSQELDSGAALTVAVWGKNITDEEYRTFGFNYGPALGLSLANYGEPRTYGVDFSISY